MFRLFNISRYIIALLVPVASVLFFGIPDTIILVLVLLFINNYLDDIVFFYGYNKVDLSKYEFNGVSSPVNGTVTAMEDSVPLYSHLMKCDVLSKEILVESYGVRPIESAMYNHLTIFLNKFNHHIVANVGAGVKTITTIDMDGVRYPMVENGELVASNTGKYLTNTFVEIVYTNGVYAIFTLDKYVSEAVRLDSTLFPMFICKGSQCDLYIPNYLHFKDTIKIGSKVEIFESLARYVSNEPSQKSNYYLLCSPEINDKYIVRRLRSQIPISGSKILASNIKKTLSSYKLLDIAAMALLQLIYPQAVLPYLLAVLLLFYTDRCVKHLMYSVINISGYKPWMTSLYSVTHKLLTYGRERK